MVVAQSDMLDNFWLAFLNSVMEVFAFNYNVMET